MVPPTRAAITFGNSIHFRKGTYGPSTLSGITLLAHEIAIRQPDAGEQWNIPGVMGWNYSYQYFGENTGRVTYAQNITDATLDRSYNYDHVGRLQSAYTGSSARACGD
jgi:hypothetical protein